MDFLEIVYLSLAGYLACVRMLTVQVLPQYKTHHFMTQAILMPSSVMAQADGNLT